jgi:hypothetical protein
MNSKILFVLLLHHLGHEINLETASTKLRRQNNIRLIKEETAKILLFVSVAFLQEHRRSLNVHLYRTREICKQKADLTVQKGEETSKLNLEKRVERKTIYLASHITRDDISQLQAVRKVERLSKVIFVRKNQFRKDTQHRR